MLKNWGLNKNSCLNDNSNYIEMFLKYKPQLSDKGLEELNNHQFGFDNNIYNILKYCTLNYTIAGILSKMYFSLVEISNLFLLCVRQNLLYQPESKIIDVAEFLIGRNKIGEYLIHSGKLTSEQLNKALIRQKNINKKIGEICVDLGYMSEKDLKPVISIKENSKKRFVAQEANNLLLMVK